MIHELLWKQKTEDILTKDEVFHLILAEMPDVDVRARVLPLVEKLVKVTGPVNERGGSKAIVVENIKELRE